MTKVLISGYYGYGNLGDEALLAGLISGLKAHHDITVLSANPEATEQLHGVKAAHRYKSLFSALFSCDAVISGGGGLLQNKTSNRSLLYYLSILRIARLMGKKCFVFGQSIGPLNNQAKSWLKSSLKGVKVAVRDQTSQELLSTLGISSECFADCALLLKNQDKATEISVNEKRPIMLIPRGGYPAMEAGLLSVAEQLKNQTIDVSALKIQADEDQETIEKLQEILPELKVYEASTPQEIISAIQNARLVISIRLHGLILSAVAQVPYMGIVYDPKVAAFLAESEATEITLPVTQELDFEQTLSQGAVEKLKQRAEAGIDWLNKHLKS